MWALRKIICMAAFSNAWGVAILPDWKSSNPNFDLVSWTNLQKYIHPHHSTQLRRLESDWNCSASNPCQNGGVCQDDGKCKCADNWVQDHKKSYNDCHTQVHCYDDCMAGVDAYYKSLNDAVVCKTATGIPVPCQEIRVFVMYPFSGATPLGSTYIIDHSVAHLINTQQKLLPGFKLAITQKDTKDDQNTAWKTPFEEFLNGGGRKSFAGVHVGGVFESTVMCVHLAKIARVPTICCASDDIIDDEELNPYLNIYFGPAKSIFLSYTKVFQNLKWKKFGLLYEHDGQAAIYKKFAKDYGFEIPDDAIHQFTNDDYRAQGPKTINSAWEGLEKSRTRVIFVEGKSMIILGSFLCVVASRGVRGLIIVTQSYMIPDFSEGSVVGGVCKDLGVTPEDLAATFSAWTTGAIPLWLGFPDDSYKLDCLPGYKPSDISKLWTDDLERFKVLPWAFPDPRGGGLAADQFCSLAFGFRKYLVTDGKPLSTLYNQDDTTTEEMRIALRNVEFNAFLAQPLRYNGNNPMHDFYVFAGGEMIGLYNGFSNTLTDLGTIKWFDGSEGYENGPPDLYEACQQGEVRRGIGCGGCPPGQYFFGASCFACAAGTANAEMGARSCEVCQSGFFAEEGSLSCDSCPVGTAPGKAGQKSCPCDLGYFQKNANTTECVRCPDPHHTTAYLAATEESECLCKEEFYLKPGEGCLDCGKGLECGVSNAPPTQMAGYSVEVIDAERREYSVYECFQDKAACPAGELGGCSGGASGQMCMQCPTEPDRMYWSKSDHQCVRCDDSGGGGWVLPVALICLAAVMTAMYFLALPKPGNEVASATVELATTAALLLLAFQTASVYSRLEISWGQPIDSILSACSILALDFGFLHLDCAMGATYHSVFVMGFIFPAAFGLTYALVGILLNKVFGKENATLRCWNATGQVIQGLFTSFLLHGIKPFLVYEHPNGKESMRSGLEVMTGSPEHDSLATCGVLHLVLYGGGFLSYCIYACWQLRKRAMSGPNSTSVHEGLWYHFFYYKYKPDCYFFGVIMLLRSASIVLTPVIFPTPHYQIMVLQFVLCLYMVVQTLLWPYRFQLHNYADIATSAAMIALTTAGAFFLPTEEDNMNSVVQPVIVLFVMCSLVYVFVLGVPFWRIVRKSCMSKEELKKLEEAERKDHGAFLAELQKMGDENRKILQKQNEKVDVAAICDKPLEELSIASILTYNNAKLGEPQIKDLVAPSRNTDMQEVQKALAVLEAKLIHRAHELLEAKAKGKSTNKARESWNEQEQKQVRALINRVQTFLPMYTEVLLADAKVIKLLDTYVTQKAQEFKGVYAACVRDQIQTQSGYDDVLKLAQELKRVADEQQNAPAPSWVGQHLELMSAAAYTQENVMEYITAVASATQGTAPWCAMKHLYRILEKQALDSSTTKSPVCDSARSMIVYDSMQSFLLGLKMLRDDHRQKKIHIRRLKERFTDPTEGGWSDVLINFEFPAQPGQPEPLVCELQMVHERMLILRKELGGHDGYAKYRAASEILELHNGTKGISEEKKSNVLLPICTPLGQPPALPGVVGA